MLLWQLAELKYVKKINDLILFQLMFILFLIFIDNIVVVVFTDVLNLFLFLYFLF